MPVYKIEGIVLTKRPFGESDAMLEAFTVTRGLETFVAKGAFRSRRRLVGGLEPFTRVEFTIYRSRPGKMAIIQDLKVLTSRFELYRDLEVFTRLCDVTMFLTKTLPPGVPEYEVYDLLEALLAAVSSGGRAESLILSFYLRVFGAMGWRMDVGACALCKKMPDHDGVYEIDFSEGRMYCPLCLNGSNSSDPTSRRADPRVPRSRLTRVQAMGLAALILPPRLKAGIAIDPAVERVLRHLIDRYLLWHTGVDLQRVPDSLRTV